MATDYIIAFRHDGEIFNLDNHGYDLIYEDDNNEVRVFEFCNT